MTDADITVYWRPGCGFCWSLLRSLDRAGLTYERANIWDDPVGVELVRSITGGDETVPTVRIGDVALVNPTHDDVLRAVETHAPGQLPEGYSPPAPGRLARAVTRLLGG